MHARLGTHYACTCGQDDRAVGVTAAPAERLLGAALRRGCPIIVHTRAC